MIENNDDKQAEGGSSGPSGSASLRSWEIPDEIHQTVSAMLEENDRLKDLLVLTTVEAQRFTIWLLGHRQNAINLDALPRLDELPEDVQQRVIDTRYIKYGIR